MFIRISYFFILFFSRKSEENVKLMWGAHILERHWTIGNGHKKSANFLGKTIHCELPLDKLDELKSVLTSLIGLNSRKWGDSCKWFEEFQRLRYLR